MLLRQRTSALSAANSIAGSAESIFSLRWSPRFIQLVINNCQRFQVPIAAAGQQGSNEHAFVFLKVFAAQDAADDDFRVTPLPTPVQGSCLIQCRRCFFSAQLQSGRCRRCDSCGLWYCETHSWRGHAVTYCLDCHFADSLETQRGAVPLEIPAAAGPVLAASSGLPPALLQKRTTVRDATLRRYALFFANQPEAANILPDPLVPLSKGRWEYTMYMARVVVEFLVNKQYYLCSCFCILKCVSRLRPGLLHCYALSSCLSACLTHIQHT